MPDTVNTNNDNAPNGETPDTPEYALAYGLFTLWGVIVGLFLGWLTWG